MQLAQMRNKKAATLEKVTACQMLFLSRSNYGKVAPETDIFENGSEICTLSCPTSKSLFDFKVAAAQE